MDLNHYTLEVDSNTKNFRWSTPVYNGKDTLPRAAGSFLSTMCVQKSSGEERRVTQLVLEKNKVLLREDIHFLQGPQSTMRQRFYHFLRRAERCRELLRTISMIEKVRDAKGCDEQ
jgi:hypothetical protein